MREFVIDTLQDSDVIRKSRSAPDTARLYYKWFDDTLRIGTGNRTYLGFLKAKDIAGQKLFPSPEKRDSAIGAHS